MKDKPMIKNQVKLNPYSRSVSIIGVGCTPFMYTVDNPETNGLTEGELFGYAAIQAMEDAGVNPQDIDFYFHGEASALNGSNYLTPNIQIANWFGMKGKALGRRMENPLFYAMAMQAAGECDVTFAGIDNTTGDVLLAGQQIIGFCFGSIMGIYPGFTARQFGRKNNSVNYGIMFIGFALAGLLGPMLMNKVVSVTGRYQPAFIACAVLALVGEVLINLFTRTAEKG